MGPSIDDKRALLQHFLGALAYRTQKALKGSPPDFGSFRAADGVRTPAEVVRHMTGVVSYARTRFVGGEYRPALLPSFDEEVRRFHEMLDVLSNHLAEGASDTSPERLLQGPLSDAMTHVGQLALLRRLAESPKGTATSTDSCSSGEFYRGRHRPGQPRARTARTRQSGRGLAGSAPGLGAAVQENLTRS